MVNPPLAQSVVRRRLRIGITVALLGLSAWLVVRLALEKNFAVDEWQYAHAAWAMARGSVPYRDFFEVHFPLAYQYMSCVYWFMDDDPTGVIVMRWLMLPVLALMGVAVWRINADRDRVLAGLGPVLLCTLLPFTERATEIRHDPISFALYAAAIATLFLQVPAGRRAAASGALMALACWGTQKMFVGGLPFLLALVLDGWRWRRGADRTLLASPPHFLLGAGAVVAVIAIDLTAHDNWGPWWHWCFEWAAEYHQNYPAFAWTKYFVPMLGELSWVFPLAALGLVDTVGRVVRERSYWHSPDLLLLGALPASFASYAAQPAPWPYSAIPFIGFLTVFAARGLIALFQTAQRVEADRARLGRALAVGLWLLLVVGVCRATGMVAARVHEGGNAHQLATLRDLGRLTSPDDAIYDNSGGYVARPHAYFYYYTEAMIRGTMQDELSAAIPLALKASSAVAVLHDVRNAGLPRSVQRFIIEHYQKYSGDLRLWGQRFQPSGAAGEPLVFHAITEGTFFVHPEAAIAAGRLRIDGSPIDAVQFQLARGEHQIAYEGSGDFYLLWLPRDGRRWEPRPRATPRFSRLF